MNRLVDPVKYTPVHTVSNIGSDGKPRRRCVSGVIIIGIADKSYHDVPSLLTMLHGVEIPSRGGETQFANTAMAYAALDEATKQRLAGLRAVHSWERSRIQSRQPARDRRAEAREAAGRSSDSAHSSGYRNESAISRQSQFACAWLAGGRGTGAGTLAGITSRRRPEFVYSHRWRPGDLVLWDNRCTMHRALPHEDMDKERRVLHRTVVKGTVPY